ncbi:hypothetical protein LPJ57_002847 [Coemansia sp. RSA 486]|nr:hypothetical protein LPJ57_002847 [Coemansia sp. RSA 486]KAJ2601235.1 hypothetical protein GGF39_001364 [Coemansia sp. RSA 1721]
MLFSLKTLASVTLLLASSGHAQTVFKGISNYSASAIDTTSVLTPYVVNNFPVLDMSSKDLRCRSNDYDNDKTTQFNVQAGSVISLWWEKDSKSLVSTTNTAIAPLGPCTVYMAGYESSGEGPQWFNVYKNGYVRGNWCSQTINNKNGGRLDVRIPFDIIEGMYLLRAEIIDLTNSGKSNWEDYTQGPAFFVNCVKVFVYSDGAVVPSGDYIPGIYTMDDPSFYGNFTESPSEEYVVPGPSEYFPITQIAL